MRPMHLVGSAFARDTGVMLEARGYDGTVTFDGQFLKVALKYPPGAALYGTRAQTRLHISQIPAIEIKEPGLGLGKFRVLMAGSQPPGRGEPDPLCVQFRSKHRAEFRAIRDAVDQARADQAAPVTNGNDLVSELAKLAQLHAAGALSDQEFAAAKARLLA